MKEEIAQLQTLQSVDLRIVELNRELNAIRDEVVTRRADIEERRTRLEEVRGRVDVAEQRRRELEAMLEDELVRIKDRQNKLMNVQTNREYQSLLRETEEAKKANKQREEELMRIMEETELLRNSMAEEANFCAAKEKLLAEEEQAADRKAEETRAQIEAIGRERGEKAAALPDSLLRKYDQLREKRNGIAVVGVKNGVCQGCHMNIPPQMFNELMRNEQRFYCPSCHRIIYHAVEGGES